MIPNSLQLKILRNPEMQMEHAEVRERLVDSSLEKMKKFYFSKELFEETEK